MNTVHLVTMICGGAAFYRYVTPVDHGSAAHDAGALMDSLCDRYGDAAWDYSVEPVDYSQSVLAPGERLDQACKAYETGDWSRPKAPAAPAATGDVHKLPMPEGGLSLQFVGADGVDVQWGELLGDGCEIVLPRATIGDVEEFAPNLLERWNSRATFDRATPLTDEELAEFRDDDEAFDQWKDSFDPVMNYAWPVAFAYGMPEDAEAIASRFAEFAPNCSLVSITGDESPFGWNGEDQQYAIALTGGGMDLSDNIVAAYLCCGCVPPMSLLERQSGVMSTSRRDRLPIAEAYDRALDWLDARRDRMMSERRVLLEKA